MSPVQNVLLRYALKNDLDLVVPGDDVHIFDAMYRFSPAHVRGAEWHEDFLREDEYDLFALHARLSLGATRQVCTIRQAALFSPCHLVSSSKI